MSLYSDFNDIEADVSIYENESLTKLESKRITKRIHSKLNPSKRLKSFNGVVAASVVLVAALVTSPTIANMPLVAGLLEDWETGEEVDWTPYKNTIGLTSVTENGELTVNEVIVDYDKLLISSTLVKVDSFDYSYQYQLVPDIYIGGRQVDVNTSAQSIEQNSTMYSVYSEVGLASPIDPAELEIELVYQRILTPNEDDPINGVELSEPWTFTVNANQLAVQEKTIISTPALVVPTLDGGSFVIDKVIRTPISTTIEYSNSTLGTETDVQLVDAEGNIYNWQSGSHEDDGTGMFSFPGASFVDKELFVEVRTHDGDIGERIAVPE